jgi:hypothetical protein
MLKLQQSIYLLYLLRCFFFESEKEKKADTDGHLGQKKKTLKEEKEKKIIPFLLKDNSRKNLLIENPRIII